MQVFSHVIVSSSATIILSAFGFPRPEDVDVSDETEVLEKANVIKCDVLCLCHLFRMPPHQRKTLAQFLLSTVEL